MTNTSSKTNWDLFIETVNTLASSQGSYSRTAHNIGMLDDEQVELYKQYINSQPPFKDSLDVILFIEQ